ncbi:MAG: T9SS type A sorting domain-containing protein [Bacteroidales bacterium]|nr:T9SS type A sorting domain-containing protein [Bacteroidales bacterium]
MRSNFLSFFRPLLPIAIFMQGAIIQAQEDYQEQIDSIFEIPASKIPSGILLDRSPAILDINGYNTDNGQQVDTCSLYKWMCVYYRLYASHLNLQDFQYDKGIAQQYLSPIKSRTEIIPLGILFYDYDKLKANAIQDGLLSVDTLNMKVRDLSGSGTPTESATCFAFSPMADTIATGYHSFHIDPSLFASNKTTTFDELYIDFDDNQGYVGVSIDETVHVAYSLSGNKTLKLKAVWGGDSLMAYAGLYVVQNAAPEPAVSTNIPVPDFGPETFAIPNDGITAFYGIWYRCNHDYTIHKPVLLVSGFDPMDKNRIGNENGAGEDNVYLYHVANKDGFLDKLRELGYDVIIYRSDNSKESIIPNALNLVSFIKDKINDVKTSDNELIVVGTSMGGLVSRYALAYMEQPTNTHDHKTKLFISMDSPQNGANVPLGVQYMVKYLNQDLFGSVEALQKAMEDMLDSDAAKEMLIYHHSSTSGLTARCATNRTNFLNSLSSIGNFPQKCRTMAVSLGSGSGVNQGFSAGASLIKKQPSPAVIGSYLTLDFLLMILNIPPTIGITLGHSSWEFEVHAVPNQTKGEIYREELYFHICVPRVIVLIPFLVPIIVLDCSPHMIDRKIEVNNTLPMDNAPGSTIGLHNLTTFDTKGLDKVFSDLKIISVDSHYDCFIPAYSALGLNVAPLINVKSYLNTCTGVTKINNNFYLNNNKSVSLFDYLYIENANLDHIYDDNKEGVFSAEMLAAMDDMISSKNLYLENKTILSGQSIAYEAAETIAVGYDVDNISTNNGDFTVESGGNLDMKAAQIVLKPGFYAKAGSVGYIKADTSWICPAGSIQTVSFSPLTTLSWEGDPEIQTQPQPSIPEEQTTYSIEQNMENEIRIFPNPVENLLNMQILNKIEGEIKITIIDARGQIVHTQSIVHNGNNVIDCSQFNSGIYLVNIVFKDSMQTIKIIKK